MSVSSSSGSFPSSFLLLVSGQIESAEFHGVPDVYCKYRFVYGPDWNCVSGFEDGLTQLCCRNNLDPSDQFIFNFPLDITLRSSSPRGWPRLVVSCYGSDWWGHDVVRGYGYTHVPTTAGRHNRRIMMFVPKSSSRLRQLFGLLFGRRAEFVNPTFIAQSESREVTQVEMVGAVTVTIQVLTKGMKKLGYDTCKQTLSIVSEYPWKRMEESSIAAPKPEPMAPKALPRLRRKLETVKEKDDAQSSSEQRENDRSTESAIVTSVTESHGTVKQMENSEVDSTPPVS